ncbi:hypothetical protein TRIUR3_18760 [Triticum urartu]|uniref:Uncharacterized protein n=1 Tax=Triticum urartu TaxID=4572 RepID=M7Z799_TRIUA|nr:hypothetical protein TRIUR3_18760 [Triticum urartu]
MGNNGVWCVLLVGLLLVASTEGDDCGDFCKRKFADKDRYDLCVRGCQWSVHLNLKPSAGEARGAMVATGGMPSVRFSVCDVWCEDVHPNMNHRLCVQNPCPYDKIPKHFSIGEAREALVAKGGMPTVRFSVCDVWCEDVHRKMNHRLCVQNLCPYDKTPRVKLTSDDLLSA